MVNEGQSNATLTQRFNKLRHEPILVSDFDSEFLAFWQLLHEWDEPGEEVNSAGKYGIGTATNVGSNRSALRANINWTSITYRYSLNTVTTA